MSELTDAQRLWLWLRDAGAEGVHSHDIRHAGYSGNPSSRMKDITSKGQPVFTAREARGKRPGSRYWLQEHAPDWSVPVPPNGADLGSGTPPGATAAAELSAEPYVLSFNTSTGEWSEEPAEGHWALEHRVAA